MKQLIVIGGGASGLAAAISAAQTDPSLSITVLEGLDRVGKKILATGNGRCNLTNENLAPLHYHSSDPQRLAAFLAQMPQSMATDFFADLGLICATEEMGRVYPYSRQASTVLDVLLQGLEQHRIAVHCDCKVTELYRTKGRYQIHCASGQRFSADRVVLTGGGMAAPKQGSDGSALSLADTLGLSSRPVYPCLTAFRCNNPALKGLKGVRAHGKLTLTDGNRVLASELGEIQFTDYGLSGIPAFQLSCHLTPGVRRPALEVDLLPQLSLSELQSYLFFWKKRSARQTLEHFLPGLIHKKLLYAVTKQIGLSPLSRPVSSVSAQELNQLAQQLKHWSFPISGTLDWTQAQVTGGGIALHQLNPDFSVIHHSGLFLAGELLDVVGDCGGYNLHWAWCSGLLAGRAAAT